MGQEANSPFWIRFNNANIRGSVKHSVLTSLNRVDPLSNWSCSEATSGRVPRSIEALCDWGASALATKLWLQERRGSGRAITGRSPESPKAAAIIFCFTKGSLSVSFMPAPRSSFSTGFCRPKPCLKASIAAIRVCASALRQRMGAE